MWFLNVHYLSDVFPAIFWAFQTIELIRISMLGFQNLSKICVPFYIDRVWNLLHRGQELVREDLIEFRWQIMGSTETCQRLQHKVQRDVRCITQ